MEKTRRTATPGTTTGPRRAPVGRPPKLTREVHAKIVMAVKAGNYLKVAAALAGVGESTLGRWMSDPRKPYRDLQSEVRRALAEFEARSVAVIARQGETNPEVLLKLLERRVPARWGRSRGLGSAEGPDPDALDDPTKVSAGSWMRQILELPEEWRMPIFTMMFAASRGRTPREFFTGPHGVDPSLKEESNPREWWDLGRDVEADDETPPGNE